MLTLLTWTFSHKASAQSIKSRVTARHAITDTGITNKTPGNSKIQPNTIGNDIKAYGDIISIFYDTTKANLLQKLNISDTQTMLNNYAIEAQMLGYLGLKLDADDSLTAYYTVYDVDTAKINLRAANSANKVKSDSSASDGYTTRGRAQHIADSVAALIPAVAGYKQNSDSFPTTGYSTRARLQKIADSLSAITATKGTGTVTSVATGYGVSGGTITSTGTISVDSAAMATRNRVQKAVDSLNVLIAAKGTGTVTSLSAGYGTTFTTITTTGSVVIDTSAIATRARVQKPIDSLNTVKTGWTDTTYITGTKAWRQKAVDSIMAVSFPADTSVGASYTLTARDFRRTIHCTNGSSINITVPTSLGTTFVCVLLREGAGDVVFVSSSTTLTYIPTGTTKLKQSGSACTIRSWATANTFTIQGDLN